MKLQYKVKMKIVMLALALPLLMITAVAQAQPHDLYGLWVKRAAFGSAGSASITHSVVDEAGNVYVSGTFQGTLNFSDDLCTAAMSTSSGSGSNGFLIKFNSTGNYQWHVTCEGTGANPRVSPECLEYGAGKIIFGLTVITPQAGTTLPVTTTYTSSLSVTKTLTSQGSANGTGNNHYYIMSLQVIDAATGALENSIGNATDGFTTASQTMAARISGNNLFVIHTGHGSLYSSGVDHSVASVFPLGAGTISHTLYPNQPLPSSPLTTDATRYRDYITLPNGKQILIHLVMQYTQSGAGGLPDGDPLYYLGSGVPAFYIMQYDAGFTTREEIKTIATREIDYKYPPSVSCDASSNIYLATNFGLSKTWNTNADISNSNILTNYLGGSSTFSTAVQKNKTLLSKLSPTTLAVVWTTQIGSAGTGGTDEVFFTDIKTEGAYTYLTGRFKGTNVPFGNGHNLSSANNTFDGFYAVYTNADGKCVYAVKMGGTNDDRNTTLFLSNNGSDVLIGGTYNSLSLQVDPSGRLYPITSNGAALQVFVARYSTDPAQTLTMPSSFGDAPESYGTAVHNAYPCLRLGALDMTKLQTFPVHSFYANSDLNDNGFTQAFNSDGFTDISTSPNQLNSNGDFKIVVKATTPVNGAAKVMGWIDFNRNGVFDAGEASTLESVAANTNNTGVSLTFAGAASKIQNGKTCLRIRLTTDPSLSATQPAGLFFDGEVEDYQLNFNLLEVNKTVSPASAKLGDELTYTITVKNNAPVALTPSQIFDPIPQHTTYVAGSANPSSGASTGNVTIDGQTVTAVIWTGSAITAGGTNNYSFKVKITSVPQLTSADSLITNVGYVVLNNDSIPSTGASCNLAETEVISFKAENDTVMTTADHPITIDVLDNDEYAGCSASNVTVTLSTHPAYQPDYDGTASVVNNKIVYTPAPGYYGIDSIRYILTGCGATNRKDSATVYIAILSPGSLQYFACQSVTSNLSMAAISNVTYYWYGQETGGSSVYGPSNTYSIAKDATATQVFWVETRYGNIHFPRYKVELNLSNHCGAQPSTGCAVDGTLIWKEDFGGNHPDDPRYSPTALPAGSDYTFVSNDGSMSAGRYALLKYSSDNSSDWHSQFSDHTHLGDPTRGYMFITDANASTSVIMYQNKIKGLCGGTMHLSLWASNLVKSNVSETQHPSFRIELSDSVDVLVATYVTSNVPQTSDQTWYSYGFEVDIPAGYDSLNVRIYTNTPNTNSGNDFVFDDIELRLCVPAVTITQPKTSDTLVCAGMPVTFKGQYDDGSGSSTPASKWLYSKTGDINNPADWVEIAGSTQTGSGGVVNNNLTINPTTVDTSGYYRLAAADAADINKPRCRAMSRVIHLEIVRALIPPDIRVYVKPDIGTVHLSSYIDSLPYAYTVAWQPAAAFGTPNNRGSLNVSSWNTPHTGTYKYTITSDAGCGAFTAKAYVHAVSKYDRTETVYICKDLPLSRSINLNRILGLEASGGTWSYPNDGASATSNNVTVAVTGKHAGARVFDAYKAFNDAGTHADYSTGTAGHKKFEFKYTNSSNITKTVRLIVY